MVRKLAKDTRKKILDAALKLFSQKGYLGATTKEIATEAGVAEVTLFRYFPSKETLFEEVINTYSFLPKLKEVIKKIEGKPYHEALTTIAYNFLELLEFNKDLIRIMHSEMQRYPEQIKKIHNNVVESTLRLLSQYFEPLQEQGILRKFNTELAARAFLGMFFSYFYVKELKGSEIFKKEDVNQVVEAFIDLFVNGTIRNL
jgi:AcrR family transcriptional regulator